MALAMKVHEVPDPVPVRLPGAMAVMAAANRLAHPLDQPLFLFVRSAPGFAKRINPLLRNHPDIQPPRFAMTA
jgi:hypothetical protein